MEGRVGGEKGLEVGWEGGSGQDFVERMGLVYLGFCWWHPGPPEMMYEDFSQRSSRGVSVLG